MKEKYLLRKLWTPMILNRCLLLTEHDDWLIKNIWKTLQTSRCGRHSSIKTFHSEKLLNILYWNWKQCTAIMKRISVNWDCNALSATEVLRRFNKQVQNLELVYKNVPQLYHSCYTKITLVHVFNSCMVDMHAKIHNFFHLSGVLIVLIFILFH